MHKEKDSEEMDESWSRISLFDFGTATDSQAWRGGGCEHDHPPTTARPPAPAGPLPAPTQKHLQIHPQRKIKIK